MKFSIFLFFALSTLHLTAQNTVGTLTNTIDATESYTLIAASNNTNTYLINNCGEHINEWSSPYRPGAVAYLLDNGDLLRTARTNNQTLNSGGAGGRIERYNWEGQLIWEYDYNSESVRQHHDIEYLPNGNILILAWEVKTQSQAIQAGRKSELLSINGLYNEHIIEVNQEKEIVWQWSLWDHLVQDNNSNFNNFGDVSNPRKLNINDTTSDSNIVNADFVHFNAIDYNPQLDQILISSRSKSEVYIIDHSTTLEEAASDTGGDLGYGGDFVYRYGNPIVYASGTTDDQQFYGQHDAHWISEGLPLAGKIMVFNNGAGRPGEDYSQIDIIDPPMNEQGNYTLTPEGTFGPDEVFYTYDGGQSFDASRVSGVQMQSNGNISICVGPSGKIFEIDENENIVWEYISPIATTGPISQGNIPAGNSIFRAYKYEVDHPAFEDKDIVVGDKLELNPNDDCILYNTTAVASIDNNESIKVYPNPTSSHLFLGPIKEGSTVELLDIHGAKIKSIETPQQSQSIDLSDLDKGIYILRVSIRNTSDCTIHKIIKI